MTVVYICIYLGRGLGRHGAVLFTRVFAFSTQCTLSYPLLAWPSKSRLLRTVTSFKLTKSYATYLHTQKRTERQGENVLLFCGTWTKVSTLSFCTVCSRLRVSEPTHVRLACLYIPSHAFCFLGCGCHCFFFLCIAPPFAVGFSDRDFSGFFSEFILGVVDS